ncbi:MAG: DnaJ C-terminal domain-containing protein [Phycisphaerales bacterium]|nr:DnaJ domain-containing protein [Planctomycetota bacterium]MCZ6612120.1 DnaJ domain-containing protein [Planctomycetota bacterium]MCZ6810618.1 DnaJ domain-containing protein [Planctomycetota bacterium]MCZ6852112.1 DnaJ domain-containing protein [Planctomycetota bacterium]
MAQTKDYYELLGIDRSATAEQIRKAYRRLARQLHPDVNKSPQAVTRFAEVQEAYEVLSDAKKRKAYDRFGHAGVGVGHRPGGFGGGGWSATDFGPNSPFDATQFADLFQDIFGRGGGSPFEAGAARHRGAHRAAPQRGQDLHHTLTVSFMTAALGGREAVRLALGHGPPQTITVKIPPGIDSGAKLRIKAKGRPGRGGGAAGDLILTVQVTKHPYFQRDRLDLLIDVPITIAEATFGAKVTLPLLSGSVEIKVPPGASSGQKHRVKGKGLTDPKGHQGDFYAVVRIVADESLSERGRQLMRELAVELKNPRKSAPWADDLAPRND